MHDLYALKEMLCKELENYGRKGDLSAGTLDIVDKLAHAVKNLGKIIEMSENEGYSEDNSYRMGQRGYSRARNSNYSRRNGSMDGGYSNAEAGVDNILMGLREMAEDLPENKKRELMKFVQKMEQM